MPIRFRHLLALILAVAAAASGCGSDEAARPRSNDLGGPRLLDPAPPGMEVLAVSRGDIASTVRPAFEGRPVEVYGSADDPFAEPAYVVTTTSPRDGETVEAYVERLRHTGEGAAEAGLSPDDGRSVAVGTAEGVVTRTLGPHEGVLEVIWPTDADTLLVVASTTASVDELLAVAPHVSLDAGRPTVADDAGLDRIGGLGADVAERPSRTTLLVEDTDGAEDGDVRQQLTVAPVTPDEQVAYRALMIEDPATEYRTAASCCDPDLLQPPRRLEIDGREAHVGAVGTGYRALVVSGDPGIVVVSGGNRLGPIHADDELVAVAEHLREATVEEVDAIVERQREAAREQSYERAVRSLAETYPGVVPIARMAVRDRNVVVAAGTFSEIGPDGEPTDPEPGVCAQYFGEQEFGLGCIRRSDWEGTATAATGWWEGILVAGDERLDTVVIPPSEGAEIEGAVLPLDLGDGFPDRVGVVFARVEMQAEPEIDISSAVPVVARDAAGQELLRVRVTDLASA